MNSYKTLNTFAFCLWVATASVAQAQAPSNTNRGAPTAATNSAAPVLSDGEVRRVDVTTGRITIRHGELKNLDMPPMTMVFQANDKSLLDQLKVGDKIGFVAEKEGSRYVVTRIERRP